MLIERLVRAGKNVLSLEEASEYTGIARSYLYKLTARGEIPFSKPRGKMMTTDKDARIQLTRNFLINLDELSILAKKNKHPQSLFFKNYDQ